MEHLPNSSLVSQFESRLGAGSAPTDVASDRCLCQSRHSITSAKQTSPREARVHRSPGRPSRRAALGRNRPGTQHRARPIIDPCLQRKTFEYGTWGGEFRAEFTPAPGEIVAQEHWCSSGFANTDLDLQLKKHGIHRLIVIGLIAHTCIEATVRYAAELGYEVTVVRDATADYSDEMMHAALDINIPNYAHDVVTTEEIEASISAANVTEPTPT